MKLIIQSDSVKYPYIIIQLQIRPGLQTVGKTEEGKPLMCQAIWTWGRKQDLVDFCKGEAEHHSLRISHSILQKGRNHSNQQQRESIATC